jgi:MFS superfamily sulfate permease-like transporter
MGYYLVIAILVGTVIGAIYYLHTSMDRNKKKKAMLFGLHSNRAHRAQKLYESIPSCYLSARLANMLITERIRNLEEIAKLEPTNNQIRVRIEKANELKGQIDTIHNNPQAANISQPAQGREIQKSINTLFQFLQQSIKSRQIDVPGAKAEMELLKQLFFETNIRVLLSHAQIAASQGKFKLASHNYKITLQELKKSKAAGQRQKQIEQIQDIINQLEEKLNPNAAKAKTTENTKKTDNKLADEFDKYFDGEDSWKKNKF